MGPNCQIIDSHQFYGILDYFYCHAICVQTASAYVLFYRRRTEGRPVRRNILDRSLSQSFADEHKKLKEKYASVSPQLKEEGEREREGGEITKEEKMDLDNEQSNRKRNEVSHTHTHRFFMLTHSDYDISPSNIKILALDFPQVIVNN